MNRESTLAPPVLMASPVRRFAELLAASAFAVAQPLYVRLSTQSPFLLDTGTTPVRLLLLTAAVYLALPLALCGLASLAGRRGPRWTQVGHLWSVVGLLFLFCMLLGRRWFSGDWLVLSGTAWLLTILCAAAVAMMAGRSLKRRWMQQLLLLGACGSILFPVQFLRTGAAATVLAPPGPSLDVQAEHPAPVVMLIFDEFCGLSLWNERHEIDAVRYPHFARLAAMSTWHRNASTVHARTNFAVPALLTGRWPLDDRETTLAEAPQNLFTLLQSAGYSTAAFEPVSRLHPPPMQTLRTGIPLTEWAATVAHALATVYVQAALPPDFPIVLPDVPGVWHGMTADGPATEAASQHTGLFRDASDVDQQFEHFLNCLPRANAPMLCLLHAMTPHCPWQFLPTGERYLRFDDRTFLPTGGVGSLLEDWVVDEYPVRQAWQRYLLQLGDVDRRLGIVLDRLEQAGILDETLLVVTGDHGVSFRPGHSRRLPDGDNLAEILSVPLFIKLPGQESGVVSDRNVESIDVLPTVTAALGIDLPLPVDGDSLLDGSLPPRARKTLQFEGGSTVVSAAFPERFAALERMLETFGSGSQGDQLWGPLGPFPALIGRDVSAFATSPGVQQCEIVDADHRRPAGDSTCNLCFGSVHDADPAAGPLPLAIAAGGRIVGTAQTSIDPRLPGRWLCLVTGLESEIECEDVRVFVIRADTGDVTLEECALAIAMAPGRGT